jgi:hypothetical protein
MLEVAGGDEGQRPDSEGVPAGDARSHPGLGRQVLEESQRGQADPPELLDVAGPRDVVGAGPGCGDPLIEAPSWGRVSIINYGYRYRSRRIVIWCRNMIAV